MATLAALGSAASLSGCAVAPAPRLKPPAPLAQRQPVLPPPQTQQAQQSGCPSGQESRRMAELFFGRRDGEAPAIDEAEFRTFVDKELARRFPEGLTVMDGGGRWQGDENKKVREAAKVVLIVLPKGRDARGRVEAARTAYRSRFHQDSVLVITEAACVSF
ncbi:MAG: DUF3574 domain-containing protein [Proteobacteria bacterium]|nr:DUF3574 domain-containing protein [Pseudomonadota bacterium]